jgi:PKD repeat protein
MRTRLQSVIVALVLALLTALVPGSADAQDARIGNTFPIRASMNLRFPDVAYNSVNDAYLVAWSVSNQPPGARFIAADGTLLGSAVTLTTKAALSVGVACGSQGGTDTCLIAWVEEKPFLVAGRLVRYGGGSVQFLTDPFVVNQNPYDDLGESDPAVAYSATSNEFLVSWAEYSSPGGPDVKAQRVGAAGAALGTEIPIAATTAWEGDPSVAYNPYTNEFLVAYQFNDGNVAVQLVQPGTGNLIGGRSTVLSGVFEKYPEVAYNPDTRQYLITCWAQTPLWVVHGRLLDEAGQPLGAAPIAVAPFGGGPQTGLAYNPVNKMFLAAFQDHDNVETWGASVSSAGVPNPRFQVTVVGNGRQAAEIAVGTSGVASRWLVLDSEYITLWGQFVGSSGVITPPTCSVTAGATVPARGSSGVALSFASTATPTNCSGQTPSYSWNFGDGSAADTNQNTTHAYASSGTYTWTLTVTVGTATATQTGTVIVTTAGACIPATASVKAKPDQTSLVAMWQSSGVNVNAGELATISAANQVWVNAGQSYSTAGNPNDILSGPNVPMPGAPRMALVGRIGTMGAPFLIGTGTQFTPSASGTLYLAPNDEWYMTWDNSLTVTVSICTGGTPCTLDSTATVPASGVAGSPVAFASSGTPSNCGAGATSYSWNFGDSTAASTEQNPSHTYAAAGSYTWTLTVQAGTATSTKTGVIAVVSAGVCLPSTATVSSVPSASAPSLANMWQTTGAAVTSGQLLTVSVGVGQTWTHAGQAFTASGNAGEVMNDVNAPMSGAPRMALVGRIGTSGTPFLVGLFTQFTASGSGELYLAPNDLWYDLGNNSGSLSVSICRGGTACAVDATATVPPTAAPGDSVAFAATCSPNNCGVATPTYQWSFGDGSTSTSQNPTHVYAVAGTYTWTMTVQVATVTTTRTGTIVVAIPTCTPTTVTVQANPGISPSLLWPSTGISVTAGQTVTITATGTWSNAGVSLTAAGNASDVVAAGPDVPLGGAPRMALIGRIGTGAPFVVGASLQITAQTSGVLSLTPNDEWYFRSDNAGSLSVAVCVGSGAVTCSVGATATVPGTAVVGDAVPFSATGTPSGCGSAVPSYTWNFGDGSGNSTSQNPTHIYAAVGTFTWTLTVQAGTATDTKTGTIVVGSAPSCTASTAVVSAAPPVSPTAIWQSSAISVTAGQVVTISVPGSQTWSSSGQAFTAAGGGPVTDPNVPLSGGPLMALVGRIGTNGTPFVVGVSKQLTADATGTLYFAPNHQWYWLWQNSGSLTISVCR